MALGHNQVFLTGTLVRAPELRYSPKGVAVLRLDMAGDEEFRDEDGGSRSRPWYHRVTVLGEQAERLAVDSAAGQALWMEGRLEHRKWQDDDGSNRSSLDVIAGRVERMGFGLRAVEDAVVRDARDQPRLRDAVNRVRLIGNLTRDAEVMQADGGTPLARFAVAVHDRKVGDADGRTRAVESTPHYIEARAWRGLAIACEGLKKGQPVYLEGRLATDAWTDRKGAKRWATRVELMRVEWLERPPKTDERFAKLLPTGTEAGARGGASPRA